MVLFLYWAYIHPLVYLKISLDYLSNVSNINIIEIDIMVYCSEINEKKKWMHILAHTAIILSGHF